MVIWEFKDKSTAKPNSCVCALSRMKQEETLQIELASDGSTEILSKADIAGQVHWFARWHFKILESILFQLFLRGKT